MEDSSLEIRDRFLVGTCGYSYPGEPPKGWSGVFYTFFNHHARGQAVANALMFQAALDPSAQWRAPRSLVKAFPELECLVTTTESGQLDLK